MKFLFCLSQAKPKIHVYLAPFEFKLILIYTN